LLVEDCFDAFLGCHYFPLFLELTFEADPNTESTEDEIHDFLMEALASITKELPVDDMIRLVIKAGEVSATTMAALDALKKH